MKVMPKPTSLLLVGALFISLFLFGSSLAMQHSNCSEELNKLKEISSDLIQSQKSMDVGQHNYPWASRQTLGIRSHLSALGFVQPTSNEKILLNGSHSSAKMQDLSAINAAKNRDLLFTDLQSCDSQYPQLVNSLDIGITGKKYSLGEGRSNLGSEVDMIGQVGNGSQRLQNNIPICQGLGCNDYMHAGNYLNVIISGVSVSALNTIEGGSAVATSNIIIEPVQMIVYDSAVSDKLK
jgi:hypothetical protein